MRNPLKSVLGYLAPEAFERRERNRLRAEVVETLDAIHTMRKWCDDAEPVAWKQLANLGPERFAPRLPHGEYERVPRTTREAFGQTVDLELAERPRNGAVRVLMILAALAVMGVGIWWN